MSKDLDVSYLNEIYGKLLTDRQREIVSQYFDYDLSLHEIAENLGISRQAVLDAVKRACEQLSLYEEVLGVYAAKKQVGYALSDMENKRYSSAEERLKRLFNN